MSPAARFLVIVLAPLVAAATPRAADTAHPDPVRALVGKYCLDCHDAGTKKGDLSLEGLDPAKIPAAGQIWEDVARKLTHRQMPPLGEARPSDADYDRVVAALTASLDRAATATPNPGRTDTFRRLNRTEYQNAVRDLLGVTIDATALLPNDEPSHGFDNVAVGNLSPTLLDRYVSAATKIARLAVGTPSKAPGGDTFRVRPDVTQEEHVEGLPLGTRGGILIPYLFPRDGDYEVQVRLQRDRNEQVEGLRRPHEVEVLLDRARAAVATVRPPGADKNAEAVDTHLKFRLTVKAGPHDVGVTFPKDPSAVLENERAPFASRFNMHRHPRTAPAVFQVSITGPFDAKGAGDTPSRRMIFGRLSGVDSYVPPTSSSLTFVPSPSDPRVSNPEGAAKAVLTPLLRRAYRRPVTDDDLRKPLQFFRDGSAEGAGFEAGIENALSAILVSPQFLFRVETDPEGIAPGTAYRVSDLELASRLSFFLWGSIPDDPLLDAAERHELRQPAELAAQVRRMLADDRAQNLVNNFAAQWLHLRGLAAITPDARRFIDFDDNLRQSMRRETELFFESVMRADRPITELLSADYTFLDERLARHYGVPHVFGSHFRRVSFADSEAETVGGALRPDSVRQRGGLLRHASILTVTSYATRTSPVIRGHWILSNLVGEPPPPPPPNVPALDEGVVSATLPIRQRLAKHRENPACASCHNVMDPVGFSLENFDAVGRWRTEEDHRRVDATGGMSDGSTFDGVAGLERALLARPELFAGTFSEKLLTFALGRGVEPYDAPAVREVVRRARADDFRFSSVILGIVNSVPFQMREIPMSTFITKTALPRRTFLRGMGAALSLPLLDSMIPAATAATRTAAKPARRLGYVFMPMGCDQSRWTPTGTDGTLAKLSPILDSLAPHRDHLTVLTNMELRNAYPGSHATSNSSFLSAAKAKHTESNDYYLATTADQLAAQQIGQATQLPSLELAMDQLQTTGQCDNGYACVYQNNLSWSSPTTPLPYEAHPRVVFERLFGEGGTVAERRAALRKRASLLDWITEDIASLKRRIGPADQAKVAEYLDTVREVERRIQKAEADVAKNNLPADLDRPLGVPAAYTDHAKLMLDLQVLAFQGDITRVITFQLARETSNRTYATETGVADPHHPLSHHGNDPEKIARMAKINAFHVSLFAYYLERLKATPDGEGTLLDHTMLLYGSGIGNPNIHDHTNLPTIVAGGGAFGLKGNRHLRYKDPVPLANLHLTLLDKAGVKIDSFADSTGKVNDLFRPLTV